MVEDKAPETEVKAAEEAVQAMAIFENAYHVEADDSQAGDNTAIHTLIGVTMQMPLGNIADHVMFLKDGNFEPSPQALRDDLVLFRLGKELSHFMSLKNYQGITLGSGRRYIAPAHKVRTMHAIWWLSDQFQSRHTQCFEGDRCIDWIRKGISISELPSLRFIVLYEGEQEFPDNILKNLLQENPGDLPQDPTEGRLRFPESVLNPEDAEEVLSESSRDLQDFEPGTDTASDHEVLIANIRNNRITRDRKSLREMHRKQVALEEEIWYSLNTFQSPKLQLALPLHFTQNLRATILQQMSSTSSMTESMFFLSTDRHVRFPRKSSPNMSIRSEQLS